MKIDCLRTPLRATARVTYNPGVPQSEIIFAIQESPEGGYQARALGHAIFTEADSLAELKPMIRDAVSCHFAAVENLSALRCFRPT